MAESLRELQESGRLVISTYDDDLLFYGIMVDAVLTEAYSYNNDIVDHPIENGSSINDHIRTRPKEYTLTGIVSDDPIAYKDMLEDVRDVLNKEKAAKRSKLARDFFNYISNRKVPVVIYSDTDTYIDYYVKSFSESQNKSTTNSLKFTLVVKEVQFVHTEFTDTKADTLKTDVKNQARKKANNGTKKKKTLKPEKQKPVQDLANDITDVLSGVKSNTVSNIFGG